MSYLKGDLPMYCIRDDYPIHIFNITEHWLSCEIVNTDSGYEYRREDFFDTVQTPIYPTLAALQAAHPEYFI